MQEDHRPRIRPVLMATLAIVGQAQYLYAPYGLASVPASQEDDFNRNTHSRQYWSPFGNSYQPQVVRPNQYFSRPSSSSSSSSYPSNYGSSGRFSSPSSSSSQTGFNTFPSSSGSSSGGNNGYSTYYREAPPKPRAPTSVNQQFQSRPQIIEQPHRVFTTKAAAAPTTPTTTTETPTTTTTTPTTTSTTPTTITTTTTTTTTTRSTTTTTRSTTTSAATITPTPLITTSETPKPVGDFRTDPTYQDEYKMFMEWLKNKKNHANIQLQRSPDEGDEKIQDTAASEAPQVTTSPILDTTIRTTSERPVVELAKTLTTQVPELPEYDALEDGEQNPDTRTDEALESTSTTTDPIATTTEVAELEETTTDVIPTIPETTTTVDEMADTTTVKDALADTTTSVPLNNQEEAREIVKIKGFLYRKVPIKVTELMKSRTKPLEEQMGIDSTDIAEEPTTAQFQSRPQIIEQPHRVFTTKAAAAPTTPTTTTETPTTTTTTPTTTSTTPTTITTTTTTTTTTRSTTTTTRSTTTSAATITPTPLITTSETPKPVGDFRTDPTYQDEYKMFMEWLKNKKNHANIQLQRSPDEGDEKIQDTAASEAPQVTTSPILDTTIRTTSERPVVELAKTLTTQVPELPEYDALEDGEQNPDTRTDEALESTSTTTDPIATTTEVAELEETTTDVIPTIPETTTTVDEMADTTTVKDALADTTTSVPLNNQEEAREIVKIKGFLYRKVPIKVTELMKSRTKPLEEQMGIDSTDIAEEPTTAVVTEGFPETTTANDDDSTTEVPITTETATDKINEGLEEDLEVSDEVSSKTTASPRVVKKINSFPRQRPGFFRRPFPLKKNRLHFLTLSAPTQVPNIFSHSMPAQTVTHRSPGVFMFNGNHRNVMRNRQKLRPFATTEPPASTTTTTTASPIEAQTTRRGWIPSRWRPAYRYTTSRKTTKIPILLNTDRSSMESSFKPMMRVMSPTRSPQKPRTVEEIDETEEKLAEERRKRILKPKRPVFIQQISPTIATEKDQPSTNRHRTTLLLKSVQPRRTLVTTTEAVEVPDTTTEMETDTGETTASPTTSAPQEELTATTRVPNSPDFIPFLGEAIPIASEDIVMEEDGLIIHVEEFEAQVNPDSIIIESAEVTVEESDESTPDVKTFRPYPYNIPKTLSSKYLNNQTSSNNDDHDIHLNIQEHPIHNSIYLDNQTSFSDNNEDDIHHNIQEHPLHNSIHLDI
eukprot:snap_masked-scaffold473_size162088-processed-gene-0.11 protein:Tk03942 transcript:snap_masked-scaffold473_size162088-processed-gene-0.11-mRNA-1 annotation:"AF312033_9ZAN"